MPQERYNAEWVRDERLGIVVSKAADIPDGAARMIGRLDRYRSRVARMENRAVFEVVEILARLLADQSRAARAGAACPPALAAGSG